MKEWQASEKEVQKMSRDGAISVNLATGEVTGLSDRPAQQEYSASESAAGTAGKVLDRAELHHARKQVKKTRRKNRRAYREGTEANSRAPSRLQFTETDRAAPELEKTIRKSEKAADRLEQAQAALPKKPGAFRQPASPLSRPLQEAAAAVHGKIREVEQDNSGVQAGHLGERGIEKAAGFGKRRLRSLRNNYRLKPWRDVTAAEAAAAKANADFLYQKAILENPALAASNPISRLWQKKRLQRQYAAAYRTAARTGQAAAGVGRASGAAAEKAAKAAKKTAEETEKTASFVVKHWKGCLIALALILMLAFLLGGISSCVSIFGGGMSDVMASSYLSDDTDLLAAEAAYCAMEDELRTYLDTYETTHDYDEYHFDLDDIEHDPYVLLSILSALHEGTFTADEIQSDLVMLFEKQYILTETVRAETRYRTETRTGTRIVTDPVTGETYAEEYEYTVQVPYTWYICTVELENFNLSHVPVYMMSEQTLSMYAVYMSALGNRGDLFPASGYVSKYITNPPAAYDIPAEYLSDERFARLITEADKYLGYPYVWGGSNPSTSFDCSGFVSWVLTDTGLCNTGRLGAQGLYNICTPVSSANVRPGDLVFFTGTYDTPGVSHVGIYVGDGMMLHCGDPIQYTSLNTNYWQSHFYAYGRPPYQ